MSPHVSSATGPPLRRLGRPWSIEEGEKKCQQSVQDLGSENSANQNIFIGVQGFTLKRKASQLGTPYRWVRLSQLDRRAARVIRAALHSIPCTISGEVSNVY